MSAAALSLRGVSKHFGGVKAVDQLDLEIGQDEIVGLIGPNGSGKSTTVNLITGLYQLTAGSVCVFGTEVSALPMHRRLEHGVARTFQNIRLFGQLSVWQNLWVAQNGPHRSARQGFIKKWLGGGRQARLEISELLEFSSLAHRKDDLAANLAFGEQRRLELARALAAQPKVLLLDEPAAGMNKEEVRQLRERILSIRKSGVTILLIEHAVELVMDVTDRIAVLNFGRKIADAAPAEIQRDRTVKKAYLGGEET